MPKNAGLMSTIGAYYRGVYIKRFFGTADGIYSTVAHPIKTVEGLTDILVKPGMLVKAVKNYTNEKIIIVPGMGYAGWRCYYQWKRVH